MLKKVFLAAVVLSLVITFGRGVSAEPIPPAQLAETNLLRNGHFDTEGFYWRPTNHFVAGAWFEWWAGAALPEFLDGGIKYHNVCYPVPAYGICNTDWGNSSQGYIRWGGPYTAGIYQPVPVQQCANYRFEAWNRNDGDNYHPKLGIDPMGWQLPPQVGDNPPYNCPPDGASKCPNPSLNSPNDFPSTMIWSPEFDHAAFSWASQSLVAEAVSSTITVWTYAAPDAAGVASRSTYWDYASLVQVPPSSGRIIGDGTFPTPDNTIQNVVSSTTAMRANLTWQTTGPAVTQVLYHYAGSASSAVLPPVADVASSYEFSTTVDYGATTAHSARLPDLRSRSAYDYAILSRKPVGNACQTSVRTGRFFTTDTLIEVGPLPTPGTDILGIAVLPFETTAYVIWQSSQPAYGQVLYHLNAPATVPPTMTQHNYLPVVLASTGQDLTTNYEFRTPVTTQSTLQIIHLTGLQRDSTYSAVAISAWSENGQDKAAASARQEFRTATTPTLASPDQLIDQLRTCVSGGRLLTSCAEELAR